MICYQEEPAVESNWESLAHDIFSHEAERTAQGVDEDGKSMRSEGPTLRNISARREEIKRKNHHRDKRQSNKQTKKRTALRVQWLRLCCFHCRGRGNSSWWSRSHMAHDVAKKFEKINKLRRRLENELLRKLSEQRKSGHLKMNVSDVMSQVLVRSFDLAIQKFFGNLDRAAG